MKFENLSKKIEETKVKLQKKKEKLLAELKQLNSELKRSEKMLDMARSERDKRYVYQKEPKKMPRAEQPEQ